MGSMESSLGHPDSYVTQGCPIWGRLTWEGALRPRVGCSLPHAGFAKGQDVEATMVTFESSYS